MFVSTRNTDALLKQLCKKKATRYQQKLLVRNVTMALLMLDSNLPICEVVNLARNNLFTQGKPVVELHVVRGLRKKSRDRFVLLSKRERSYIELMDDYWWTPDADKPGSFAFYNRTPIRHITRRQFQRIIKQAGLEVFGCSITPNSLRQY